MQHTPVFGVVYIMAVLTCSCQAQPAARAVPAEIKTEPPIRALWTRLARPTSSDDAYQAFNELDRLSGKGHGVELIQQGLLLASEDRDALQMMIPGVYIPKLGLWSAVVLRATVPLLDSSDERVREQAEKLIEGLLSQHPQWIAPDDIRDYLRENCPDPPPTFITFLYSISPGSTLLALNAAYTDPDRHRLVLWAEHVVADAIWMQSNDFPNAKDNKAVVEQLEILVKRPEWWVRLYVAHIIVAYPKFAAPGMLAGLRRDDHSLVRAVAGGRRNRGDDETKTRGE